ncbi:unnamed protein product [Rotaria sp. Silwood1]|nr:unnamed protein product [Rotaria sp. Silwood1]CAF4929754.1 unnamed protein product [Rotaria sp. Silwood1]CAF4938185.1 unnamed protein product [Rotaria sp. Silwood1]
MKTYNFRINRPKPGDEYFKKLHFGQNSNDVCIVPKARNLPKTRWLRGIGPHIQQIIFRVSSDRAKGEKRVGKISLSNTAVVSALERLGSNYVHQITVTAHTVAVAFVDLTTEPDENNDNPGANKKIDLPEPEIIDLTMDEITLVDLTQESEDQSFEE